MSSDDEDEQIIVTNDDSPPATPQVQHNDFPANVVVDDPPDLEREVVISTERRGRGRPKKNVLSQSSFTSTPQPQQQSSSSSGRSRLSATPQSRSKPTTNGNEPEVKMEIEEMTYAHAPRSARAAARGCVLDIDDDENHIYPCPATDCDYIGDTRSARNYHLRTDHPKFSQTEGTAARTRYSQSGSVPEREKMERERAQRASVASTSHERSESPDQVERRTALTVAEIVRSVNTQVKRNRMELERQRQPYAANEAELDDEDAEYAAMDDAMSDADNSDFDELKESVEAKLRRREQSYAKSAFLRGPHHAKRGRPKNPPGTAPCRTSKVRVSKPDGKYACYLMDCSWRGGYRSIRADHMKWVHPEWIQPPRFLLQRISKDGLYLDPSEFTPEYGCTVEGCDWRGNYRASRATHMRAVHPEYCSQKKKAPIGGYLDDGPFTCHLHNCTWRGSSRSTRAAHMKREHPGFVNPTYSPRNVPCCDCSMQLQSHKAFVNHMVTDHRIGGIVHREFTDVRDYEEWFDAVQESFSVAFIKKMGVKQAEAYHILYLYCDRSGGYRQKRPRIGHHPYVAEYPKKKFNTRGVPKCGKNCAAFLRVVHWNTGQLTVVGCVEHTGHRMGTSLLRLSPPEREIMDEYLYMTEEDVPLEIALDRLRDADGFLVNGYDVIERSMEEISQFVLQDDELISLHKLIHSNGLFAPGDIFNENLLAMDGSPLIHDFTLGLMTEDMKELWRKYSPRAVCIEEVRLMINSWDVSLFFVLVFDDSDSPRCACIYLTQISDKTSLIRQLRLVSDAAVDTIVTDCAPEWPEIIDAHFGENGYTSDIQIAEWHLLGDWAAQCDQLVQNRVDRFSIICALRRWIRASEPNLFEGMVIEMFEALREMELDELAQYLDSQLTVPDYAKRWTPMNRNVLTDHSNPTLEIACRMLRDRFLNCSMCQRLDEYVGLLSLRIKEFNSCQTSGVFATREPEPPRHIPHMYEDVDPSQMMADGTVMAKPEETVRERITRMSEAKRAKMEDEQYEEEVIEEVIQGPEAEQLVEQVVLNGDVEIEGMDQPSVDVGDDQSDPARREKIKRVMEMLNEKVDSLQNDELLELVETSLSQVAEQIDTEAASLLSPKRSTRVRRTPKRPDL